MEEKKKGLNTNSNLYTIIYAAIIVVIVAFLLAFVSQALKEKQDANVALDQKKQILNALNLRGLGDEEAMAKYKEVVVADQIIDANGNVVKPGSAGGENDGFRLNSADFKNGQLAVFLCNVDGKTKYVIPVYGMGLWGAIRGFLAVDEDKNTIYGAYFNHDSETAGLGAEIKDNASWQAKFQGKKIFAEGNADEVALAVKKKNDITDPSTQVDGITGATLTCDGVSNMFKTCLKEYRAFLKNK